MLRLAMILLFTSTVSFPQRGPGIPTASNQDIDDIYCDYQNKLGSAEFVLMDFIPIFENMYNTNQIQDPDLKEAIHCALLSFYQESDPFFAEDFSKLMPEASCP